LENSAWREGCAARASTRLCGFHSVRSNLVFLFLFLCVPCAAQESQPAEAARIRQLISNYAAAVNAADALSPSVCTC
jgi:hypothetical protein